MFSPISLIPDPLPQLVVLASDDVLHPFISIPDPPPQVVVLASDYVLHPCIPDTLPQVVVPASDDVLHLACDHQRDGAGGDVLGVAHLNLQQCHIPNTNKSLRVEQKVFTSLNLSLCVRVLLVNPGYFL